MKIIDLHCDTIGEMYDRGLDFQSPELDLAADSVAGYEQYVPVTAIWSRYDLPGEDCWKRFIAAADYADAKLPREIKRVLAVEGGKLLCGDLSRLDVLAKRGVKILTLTWADTNELGGAHNTDVGLTDFGREAVRRCFELGIVPDVSHASDATFAGVRELAAEAGKPFIASHSNSRAVWDHRRNLTDEMYLAVVASGGVVGVSLEPTHLAKDGVLADAVRHITHYVDLAPDGVCLGCDFDGRSYRPDGLERADCLVGLAQALSYAGMTDLGIEKVYYSNALRFFTENGMDF